MAFEYCCFISYPHGQEDVLVPIVDDFVQGLKREIGAVDRRPLWFDQVLTGGRRIDEAVGAGLCKSACMIMLYTPLYFDEEHVYCARELKAMQDLEEERLRTLKDKSFGLIIPVILRGEKRFPDAMKKGKFYDFTQFLFNSPSEKLREKYAAQIREIAAYILDRCDSLEAVERDPTHNCDAYPLPTIEVAKDFVEQVLAKKIVEVADSFPGRKSEPAAEVKA
jgi:TIR domain-containing protein